MDYSHWLNEICQQQQTTNQIVNHIDTLNLLKRIAEEFTGLITKIGRSKKTRSEITIQQKLSISSPKGQKSLINMKGKVKQESENLLEQWHVEKLEACSYQSMFLPIVITVKQDSSNKIDLAWKTLNKLKHKNKCQMPKIDSLIQLISQKLSINAELNGSFFATIYLNYAHIELNLHPERVYYQHIWLESKSLRT